MIDQQTLLTHWQTKLQTATKQNRTVNMLSIDREKSDVANTKKSQHRNAVRFCVSFTFANFASADSIAKER